MKGFFHQKLEKLVETLPIKYSLNGELPNDKVTGIEYDSRQIKPGNIFIAFEGINVDGHQYISHAAENGAIAAVGTKPFDASLTIPYLQVDNSREAMAHLAAAFYNFPARKMTIIGVTGTDGKTTTVNLLYQILVAANLKAGIISTINAVIGDEVIDTGFHVTTPEAPDIQRYLSRMYTSGITHVVLETTSHGLAQHRVTACEYDIAVVTNITHEHLFFHKTIDEYRNAKASLFRLLSESHKKPFQTKKLAVINYDDESYDFLKDQISTDRISYGLKEGADIQAVNIEHNPNGNKFDVIGFDKNFPVTCNLIGLHNISNSLAAISATMSGLGISKEDIQKGIKNLQNIPGRMETISMGQKFHAIVDFAHTPNALLNALKTVRNLTEGKVIVVFGSAGLRDHEKRRLMPENSVKNADISIFTAEDPRTESLDDILQDMADAAEKMGAVEGKDFYRVLDRGNAIRKAISMAKPGDIVISCGKGHEQSMCFETTEYDWDDRTAMKAALAEYLGISGPDMPFLPTQDKK